MSLRKPIILVSRTGGVLERFLITYFGCGRRPRCVSVPLCFIPIAVIWPKYVNTLDEGDNGVFTELSV